MDSIQYKNRQWVLETYPEKRVTEANFSFKENSVASLNDGEFLVRNQILSFEPAQRGWLNNIPSYIPPVAVGEVMRAIGLGEVVESKNPSFKVGDCVQGPLGWQDYATLDGKSKTFPTTVVPNEAHASYYLHVYGITGLTAYFGLFTIGEPKAGDTVVVSAAAGATGSVVGQLAKQRGCKVIGIAGGMKKCDWLVSELGFDHAIDYRSENVSERLTAICPNSIDVFFDNVGGSILDAALVNLAQGARVVLCGGISSGYHAGELPPGPKNYMQLVIRRCKMQGFLVLDYIDNYLEAIEDLKGKVESGDLSVKEDIAEGLENCPATLTGLFDGKNFGKQLLRI